MRVSIEPKTRSVTARSVPARFPAAGGSGSCCSGLVTVVYR